jgi:hypothetical protein
MFKEGYIMSNTQTLDRAATLADLGLAIKTKFIPFSQSRNANDKHPTLNYKVTLIYKGREVLTTDYSMGCAFVPGYQQFPKDRHIQRLLLEQSCETGYVWKIIDGNTLLPTKEPILPDAVDVIYSLIIDSEVLDAGRYEEWADAYGYDVDSRKGEATYRACLDIALRLRASLGDEVMSTLRELFVDY